MINILATLKGQINGMSKGVLSELRASAKVETDELVLEVYGLIGQSFFDEGIMAAQVAEALKQSSASVVTLRINSPGGNMFEGLAIYNVLKTSGKGVRVIVDGLAASAASLIAMAGDSIEMNTGTMMMIHPAQIAVMGDSVRMREVAEILEKASGCMADVYAARTEIPRETVIELMYAETWMTAQEAVDQGFADTMSSNAGNAKAVATAFNLSALYAKTPEALKVFNEEPEPEPIGTPVADAARRGLELY